jgi:hypothetical protein
LILRELTRMVNDEVRSARELVEAASKTPKVNAG